MKYVYLTKDEIQIISDALDEYIIEHCLDDLSMSEDGKYYGSDELEIYDAQKMNNIQSVYSKIW